MPRARRSRKSPGKSVDALRHEQDSRRHIPTAECQSLLDDDSPMRLAFQRRNRDLDPQLVWRGKDEQGLADLTVDAPPLYIQEKVRPKALIDDLLRQSRQNRQDAGGGGGRQKPARSICSPTSTACPKAPTAPSSTSTTPTGPTA